MLTTIEWSAEKILASLPKEPDALLAAKCPPELQQRLAELLELNRSDSLDDETRQELDRFMELNSAIWKLKAKALKKKSRGK
jgi:hypothetical protein